MMSRADKINFEDKEELHHLANVIRLYRAIFDLACTASVEDKTVLRGIRSVVSNLNNTLYEYLGSEDDIGLGFCQDFNEYMLLKFDDDGTDRTGWIKGFEVSIRADLDKAEVYIDRLSK